MGSIDLSLENIWKSWTAFRKGKQWSSELHEFQYHLERNLFQLFVDLNRGIYQHGPYRQFIVSDNKTRLISVSSIRDRIVHRLVYDYLNGLFDHRFHFDAWSCRKGKGLLKAIERAESFLRSPDLFVYRADIHKFFDHVDHELLMKFLSRVVKDQTALHLCSLIIWSFEMASGKGIPIGNLTSQIFANIYLHEFDRFIHHEVIPKSYLRYGDDFLVIDASEEKLQTMRQQIKQFLTERLLLTLHPRTDLVIQPKAGIRFLGIVFYPKRRMLSRRNRKRIIHHLNPSNISSYYGLVSQHEPQHLKDFFWRMLEL